MQAIRQSVLSGYGDFITLFFFSQKYAACLERLSSCYMEKTSFITREDSSDSVIQLQKTVLLCPKVGGKSKDIIKTLFISRFASERLISRSQPFFVYALAESQSVADLYKSSLKKYENACVFCTPRNYNILTLLFNGAYVDCLNAGHKVTLPSLDISPSVIHLMEYERHVNKVADAVFDTSIGHTEAQTILRDCFDYISAQ
ncbi:hypothetical protein CI610_01069 [invertebrate metagenome]|uniref:Uncharacterized protein n=1 Tax=invertebrate metagenome TaxID=1711999 RepID=A0A2H9T9R0_9ZZZZ